MSDMYVRPTPKRQTFLSSIGRFLPHGSKPTRISPQLPSFPKSRTAVSCARRGEANSPSSAGFDLPHRPGPVARSGWSRKERMRGVFMESNQGPDAKAAVSSPSAHRASGGFAARRRRSRAHGPEGGAEMKIMIFSVNIAKFQQNSINFRKIFLLQTVVITRVII